MAISNFPTALQPAIQQGFLQREFQSGLTSQLGYRDVAAREDIAINIGETVTKTRRGLKGPVTVPLASSALDASLDNGLTASSWTIEQYVLGMAVYADTINLNVVTSQVGIANQFLQNAKVNGTQAKQSLDRLARNALFSAYLGGNTSVRVTLGSPATTIQVDDVRGFQTVLVNGQYVAVSGTNTASVLVGSNTYTLTGVAVDGTNVSSLVIVGDSALKMSGISGTLTFSGNVTVADATAGNQVQHANAPSLLRGGTATRNSWKALVSGDVLKAQTVVNAVAQLRNNTGLNTTFNLYLDNMSMAQLFADNQFQLAYQGQYGSKEMQEGKIFELYGTKFIPTTEAPTQTYGALTVRRPILVAEDALIEGDFAGMTNMAADVMNTDPSQINFLDGVCQVTREPMDRLGMQIAQSWFWIGGFVAPVDATATSGIIPTTNAAYYKRALVIEHV